MLIPMVLCKLVVEVVLTVNRAKRVILELCSNWVGRHTSNLIAKMQVWVLEVAQRILLE